jgi:hypothetical protein
MSDLAVKVFHVVSGRAGARLGGPVVAAAGGPQMWVNSRLHALRLGHAIGAAVSPATGRDADRDTEGRKHGGGAEDGAAQGRWPRQATWRSVTGGPERDRAAR